MVRAYSYIGRFYSSRALYTYMPHSHKYFFLWRSAFCLTFTCTHTSLDRQQLQVQYLAQGYFGNQTGNQPGIKPSTFQLVENYLLSYSHLCDMTTITSTSARASLTLSQINRFWRTTWWLTIFVSPRQSRQCSSHIKTAWITSKRGWLLNRPVCSPDPPSIKTSEYILKYNRGIKLLKSFIKKIKQTNKKMIIIFRVNSKHSQNVYRDFYR